MKEVKNEIFGSRKSYLKEVFKKHKLAYADGFFVVTCRARINSDKKTRYLILIENQNNLDTSNINENIPIYQIKFDKQYAYLTNLRNEKDVDKLNFEELRRWIVNKTKCKYIQSYGSSHSNIEGLSKFFRENMGKGFSLTDIDFYLIKNQFLVEEKTFIVDDYGYLGQGQFYSFKEVVQDIQIMPNLYIILSNNGLEFFILKFDEILKNYEFVNLPKWGRMVKFKLPDANTQEEIINEFYG